MEQVKSLNLTEAVRFVGFQQNPWPYLRHADLLVLPSRREGFSNVLLEALALGTPAVATDSPGGVREIYGTHPAVTLVPAEDPASLAEAIIEKHNARERTQTSVAAEWFARFSVQRITGEYSALFLA